MNVFLPSHDHVMVMENYRAASLLTDEDHRLFGSSLVKPFRASYQLVKPLFNPIRAQDNVIKELAIRSFYALWGTFGMFLSAPLALIGRISQISHYISGNSLDHAEMPIFFSYRYVELPKLEDVGFKLVVKDPTVFENLNLSELYYFAPKEQLQTILRKGLSFNQLNGKPIGEAIYLTPQPPQVDMVQEGDSILKIKHKIHPHQVAYVNLAKNGPIRVMDGAFAQDESREKRIAELFRLNGYRAVAYHTQNNLIRVAILDPNAVSIEKIV